MTKPLDILVEMATLLRIESGPMFFGVGFEDRQPPKNFRDHHRVTASAPAPTAAGGAGPTGSLAPEGLGEGVGDQRSGRKVACLGVCCEISCHHVEHLLERYVLVGAFHLA